MHTTRSVLALLGVTTTLGGCFIPFTGMGKSRDADDADRPRTVPLEPVMYEELVAQVKATPHAIGEMRRDLTPRDDLYLQAGGIKRVNRFSRATSSALQLVGLYPMHTLTFAGVKDGKLCWIWDQDVGGKGDKRIVKDVISSTINFQVNLVAVDDLSQLKGPISTPPPDGLQVAWVSVLETDLDDKDDRYAILETCSVIPPITERTTHLVMTIATTQTVPDIEVRPGDDVQKEKDRARLGENAVLAWKLVGSGAYTGDTTAAAAAAAPTTPAPTTPDDATPAKPSKPAKVSASGKGMTLPKATVAPATPVRVVFDGPMTALPGEKYWITIVSEGADDTAYTSYKYLEPDAREIELAAPGSAGRYEVRLHGNYPTKTYNLLQRAKLTVR